MTVRRSIAALRPFGLSMLAVTALALAGRPLPSSAGGAVLYQWVELGPSGRALARAIVAGEACPQITLDGQPRVMTLRAAPAGDFTTTVCEARVEDVRDATIAGERLPLPVAEPRRIVVIGDTGCRLKDSASGGAFQACNDPAAWPFATIAGRAAAWAPDLVIHVGDYLYRESPCPAGNPGCAGSPFGGATWAAWEADFFAPAAPLLRVAPWVFVRGNHETCDRAGAGWFRFLDPFPYTDVCQDYTPPYTVPLGDLQILMLDSSIVDDIEEKPEQVAAYREQLVQVGAMAALNPAARENAWLLMHHPLWAFGHAGVVDGMEQLFRDNPNLQAAAAGTLPPATRLVLTGHIHLFEALDFAGARPSQLVAGTGGTALDPQITTPLAGLTIDRMAVAEGTALARFGYLTVERSAGGFAGMLRGVDGSPLVTCRLDGPRLRCAE
jgi:hypothetical protein